MSVLDIGAGTGFQSAIMASWGCHVVALDVRRTVDAARHHPIILYDGKNLPVRGRSVDVAFSSNVLEHVRDQPRLLAEIRRVLKPGAHAIHIVPSATWRFWTSVSRYPNALLRGVPRGSRGQAHDPAAAGTRRSWVDLVWGGPHGEYTTAAAELGTYQRRAWLGVFRANGFDVLESRGNGLFYTGHAVLPRLPMVGRRGLARVLGSACHIFVMRCP